MEIYHLDNIEQLQKDTAIALGFFDGLHLGHRRIFEALIKVAREKNLASALFTFRRHPLEVLYPGLCFPYIITHDEKVKQVECLGIDYFIDVQFDEDFSNIPASKFFDEILAYKLRGKAFIVGRDYHFGRGAEGNVEMLKEMSARIGAEVYVIEDVTIEGERVGSTAIREAILSGNIEAADKALGRWYSISGEIIGGKKRGTKLGMPTANIELPVEKVMPHAGVYAVFVLLKGKLYKAAANVGSQPTFNENRYIIEAHLIDFDGYVYGEQIRVFFVKHLRESVKFETPEKLTEQVRKDTEQAKKILSSISDETIKEGISYSPACNQILS